MICARRTALHLLLAASAALASCGRAEGRCVMCGMKITKESVWRAEVVYSASRRRDVDTPRCAFAAKHSAASDPGRVVLRFQDHYDRGWYDEAELVFVTGSDVMGPMGPDLVPVLPKMAPAFVKDHGKKAILGPGEVTPQVLASL